MVANARVPVRNVQISIGGSWSPLTKTIDNYWWVSGLDGGACFLAVQAAETVWVHKAAPAIYATGTRYMQLGCRRQQRKHTFIVTDVVSSAVLCCAVLCREFHGDTSKAWSPCASVRITSILGDTVEDSVCCSSGMQLDGPEVAVLRLVE